MAITRSSSGGFAIRYVLPVLRMMSRWRRCDTGAEFDVYECIVDVIVVIGVILAVVDLCCFKSSTPHCLMLLVKGGGE